MASLLFLLAVNGLGQIYLIVLYFHTCLPNIRASIVGAGPFEVSSWLCPAVIGTDCESGFSVSTKLLHWFHLAVFAIFYVLSLGVTSIPNS